MKNGCKIRLEGAYALVNTNYIGNADTTNMGLMFPYDITIGKKTSALRIPNNLDRFYDWISVGIIKMVMFNDEEITLYVDDTQYTLERIL